MRQLGDAMLVAIRHHFGLFVGRLASYDQQGIARGMQATLERSPSLTRQSHRLTAESAAKRSRMDSKAWQPGDTVV